MYVTLVTSDGIEDMLTTDVSHCNTKLQGFIRGYEFIKFKIRKTASSQ